MPIGISDKLIAENSSMCHLVISNLPKFCVEDGFTGITFPEELHIFNVLLSIYFMKIGTFNHSYGKTVPLYVLNICILLVKIPTNFEIVDVNP